MRSRHLFQAFTGLLGLVLATPAVTQTVPIAVTQQIPCDPGVPCHELRIDLRQPGAGGTAAGRRAKVKLLFERVFGLTDSSFTVTAQEVSPSDPTIAARMPRGVFVNAGLPWLISIVRDPRATVKFQGQWMAILETDDTEFDSTTPTTRSFYRRTADGFFADITPSVGIGSYVINFRGGDFGQFLIANDLRPPDQIAFAAYGRLEAEIRAGGAAGAINAGSQAVLLDALDRSRDAFSLTSRTRVAALVPLDELIREAELRSGSGVEDQWDPGTGKVSVAGTVRALAETTRLAVGIATRPRALSTASFLRQLVTPAGHKLQVEVSFPGQVGNLGDSLDISARDISASELPAFLARLPAGVTLPAAFRVVVHVGPATAASRLVFRGPWDIQVITDELDFGTSVRLFKASDASSPFGDITATVGIDSVRTGGKTPKFSEFVIALDGRDLKTVTTQKLDVLEDQLEGFASQIASSSLRDQLAAKLAQARALAAGTSNKRLRRAIGLVDDFVTLVSDNSGVDVPDIHREGDSAENVAGTLIGGAQSLRLTLTLRLKPEGS